MEIKKPDVLVAGFPKSGSTYLYHLLKQHPDIFIPKIKEINYFNKDHFFLNDLEALNPRYFKPKKWYFNFFRTDKKVVVDFSILSALDVASARRARKMLGDVKIMFIVRNKKEFLNSVKSFSEKEGGLDKNYKELADFEYFISIYERLFSEVQVIRLDDLNNDTEKELQRILDFLGLEMCDVETKMPRHKTEEYKMGFLRFWKRRIFLILNKMFYRFLAITVRAKIKAQGEGGT